MNEAQQLAQQGVRELNLVAQDLTEYGMEWKYKENLEMLLPELCKVEGIDWIRLHYIYPDQFSDALIEIIAREPKILKYLDMPIQHTNDRVLQLMNRKLTNQNLFNLIQKLRAKIPNIVFRTSIIVGFPTETDEEFNQLCSDLKTLNLDHVGVFRYSKEEGTKAAEFEGQIHANVKRKRSKILTEVLQAQAQKRNDQYIGTLQTVLFEGMSQDSALLLQARLPTQAQEIDGHVLINDLGNFDPAQLQAGDLVEVQITEAHPLDLVAKMTRIISKNRIPSKPHVNASLTT